MSITYTNETLDFYKGQINCEAGIYFKDEIVGVAQYVLYKNILTISYIFVIPEFRRMGFGSRLVKYIQLQNPGFIYKPSLKTNDGSNFIHKDLALEEKLSAKFVCESLKDVFRPKTNREIQKSIRENFDLNNINLTIKSLPTIQDYLKTFTLTKTIYSEKLQQYIYADLTKEGISLITKATQNLNFSFNKIKVLQITGGNTNNDLKKLMYVLNNSSKTFINFSNEAFDYMYNGADYAFIGNGDGFHLFFIPLNFIDKMFGTN